MKSKAITGILLKVIYWFVVWGLILAFAENVISKISWLGFIEIAVESLFGEVAAWLLEQNLLLQLIALFAFAYGYYFVIYWLRQRYVFKEGKKIGLLKHVLVLKAIFMWGTIGVGLVLFKYVGYGAATLWLLLYIVYEITREVVLRYQEHKAHMQRQREKV